MSDEALQTPAVGEEAAVSVTLVSVAGFLASAAAGWTAGSLFRGALPRATGIVAAALGAAVVAIAHRTKRQSLVQAIGLAVIVLTGLALALAGGSAHGGLGGVVADAIRGGGPAGEAMPFEAGWRLILVVLIATLAAGASSLGIATRRPRFAVLLPVPPLVGAAAVAPPGAALSSAIPAMALVLGALIVAYSVELAGRGAFSRRFEMRRIGRGIAAIAIVVVFLTGMSHASVLFPIPDRERVIPAQLPPDVPPLPDRVLFTVRSATQGPWRLGVLDVYDGRAWRLPPYDPERLQRLAPDGRFPDARPASPRDVNVTFVMSSLPGPVLPAPAGARVLGTRPGIAVRLDPRTQMLRAPAGTAPTGTTYSITAAPLPFGKELQGAPAPRGVNEFLETPPAPPGVAALLEKMPRVPMWDRLQAARAAFYAKVVAAGAGKPVPVPPARVDQILAGKPASPYEITAAEALIARWAGVPTRIGYGFFEGDKTKAGWSVHPRHAATWLETYFEGYGWVPIVGVPPRAKGSLNHNQKKSNPIVRPTEQLALVLYVPIHERTFRAFYVVARYWIAVALPFAVALVAAIALYPGAIKVLRRMRRSRWANKRGLPARIAAAYSELRDAATDLAIGTPTLTPIEFAKLVAHDDELIELSWLVSRSLWGDLRRDLREEDADAAARMTRSVIKRMRRAQPAATRLLAVAARASLREPFTLEVPNLWPSRRIRVHPVRRVLRALPLRRLRRVIPVGAALAILLSACAASPRVTASATGVLPDRIVPAGVDTVSFKREPAVESRLREVGDAALIDAARVFTFRNDREVQGYLEVGSFKAGVSGFRQEIRRGVLKGIGAARFRLTRAGRLRVYAASLNHENFLLWFSPEGSYFELLIAHSDYAAPLDLLAKILTYQGRNVGTITGGGAVITPIDPRRGEAT
ncbi:MAG: DUF3488 and transglutaminase-like domain-containing protein [Actinomycetota bacterium]